MTSSVTRETRRLRRVLKKAAWAAFAAGQIAVPYLACSSADAPTSSGAGSSSGSSTGQGGNTTSVSSGHQGGGGGETSSSGATGGGNPACEAKSFLPDASDDCGSYIRLPCGLPSSVVVEPACTMELGDCANLCGELVFGCHVVGSACIDGGYVPPKGKSQVEVDCDICLGGVGRSPAGLAPRRSRRPPQSVGDHFAAVARLEAASVQAFRRLSSELAANGAPVDLVRAAERAERDERRHTRDAARLARRFGCSPLRARVAPPTARPLTAMAFENAVEGCVRETFGALVATWQAAHATDVEIASLMQGVARDETRHAALAWAVARWSDANVGPFARARARRACRAAIAELRRGADANLAPTVIAAAGVPDPQTWRRLVDELERGVWASFASEAA